METPVTPFSILMPAEFYEDQDRRIRQIVSEMLGSNASDPAKKARYLTRRETCELLNISMPTLSRYITKGLIRANKIGNRILIDQSELQESLHDVKLSGR